MTSLPVVLIFSTAIFLQVRRLSQKMMASQSVWDQVERWRVLGLSPSMVCRRGVGTPSERFRGPLSKVLNPQMLRQKKETHPEVYPAKKKRKQTRKKFTFYFNIFCRGQEWTEKRKGFIAFLPHLLSSVKNSHKGRGHTCCHKSHDICHLMIITAFKKNSNTGHC